MLTKYLLADMLYSGALMGLISIGFFVCLKYCKVFLMSYGGIVLAGSYISTLVPSGLLGWLVALLISVVIGALLGWLHFLLLKNNLREYKNGNSILLTWGVALVLSEFYRIVFGPAGRFTNPIFVSELTNTILPTSRLFVLAVTIFFISIIIGLFCISNKTRLRLEALSESHRTAAEYGIPVTRYLIILFISSGIIASVSGVLLSQDTAVTPYLGVQYTILAALAGLIVGPKIIQGFIVATLIGFAKVYLGFQYGLTAGWLLVLLAAIIFAAMYRPQVIKYGS